MKTKVDELTIEGTVYVPRDSNNYKPAIDVDGLRYVIIRADRAGVFAGYLYEDNDEKVILKNARRLWYWDGASSISQLAIDGTNSPDNCKFPAPVPKIKILGVIENLDCTQTAKESIERVSIWKQ